MSNMKLVTVFFILKSTKYIQACRTGISKDLSDGKKSFLDYSQWKLPPDNTDWWGFVNLLGTRGLKDKVTESTTTEMNSMENEQFFPWPGLGVGKGVFNPPPESKIKNYIGQSYSCLYAPARGNGSEWYLRWYYDVQNDDCKRFVYSGSGGNTNRFISEWHCNQHCRLPAKPCCVPDTLFNYAGYLEKPDLALPTS